ncbi:MAG: glycine cleavage system aminomethyltransferase GcvT [Firmicutes bacterium]|nr:glycine cleavage system aminomethyltransferase GcvT [Bacillota bacterium]
MELKTPLYDTHVKYNGKIVPFGGFLLPVQYEAGVIKEHMAVRTACGLFDVSHMGEVTVKGPDALKCLNHLMTNDFTDMADGDARYSPMANEKGGTVDDLIVYKKADGDYLVVVNAANTDKDFAWMCDHKVGDCELENISASMGQLALQGPLAQKILEKIADPADIPAGYYTANFNGKVAGIDCIISRTGYTGEDGFELYMAAEDAVAMWEALIEAGKEDGLLPCGLGARDTLRLEAAMPLYGHEMNEESSPRYARLGVFIKKDKEEFVGKDALMAQLPLQKRGIGLKVTGRGIIREECDLYDGDKLIGRTTSGTHSPYFKEAIAMAIVDAEYKEPGTKIYADVRGRRIEAEIVKLPFYKREK